MSEDTTNPQTGVSRITDEQIINAVAEIGPRASVQEVSDRFDYSDSAMRDRFRKLREDGRLELAYQNYNAKFYTAPEPAAEDARAECHPSLPKLTKQAENGDLDVDDLADSIEDIVDFIHAADTLTQADENESELEDMIEAVESGDIDIDELASVFDDITGLIQVCSNKLDRDQQQELAEKLGMSALIARSPGLYFRDLRNHVESSRERMGVSSRSEDSVSVR